MLPFYLGVASSVLVEWYQTGDMSKATYLANFIIRTLASVKKRKDLITFIRRASVDCSALGKRTSTRASQEELAYLGDCAASPIAKII